MSATDDLGESADAGPGEVAGDDLDKELAESLENVDAVPREGVEDELDEELAASFETFYRQHRLMLWAHLYSTVRLRRDLIDDLVQDIFLVMRRHWRRPEVREKSPKAYMFKAATREAARRQKKDRSTVEYQPDSPDHQELTPVPDPAALWVDRESLRIDHDRLRAALHLLSPRLRQAVELRHLRRLSVADTAQIMGVTTGAVTRYTHDGLQRLRELLTDQTGTGEVDDQ